MLGSTVSVNEPTKSDRPLLVLSKPETRSIPFVGAAHEKLVRLIVVVPSTNVSEPGEVDAEESRPIEPLDVGTAVVDSWFVGARTRRCRAWRCCR